MTAPARRGRGRPWRLPPPLTTFAVLVVVIGAYLAVGVRESAGNGNDDFIGGVPWQVWKLTAAVSVAVWVVVLLLGVDKLRRRSELGLRHISNRTLGGYLAVAALTAGAVVAFIVLGNQEPPFTIPVADFPVRSRALVATAAVCAVPWLVLVWLCHREVRTLGAPIDAAAVDVIASPVNVPGRCSTT